ncbi:hypothetical protein J14TS5_34800 [Paenibacillus lautus]|nr:hypothetical protein J14TS5_34800 [Paenibacillus lautus]
MCPGIRHHCRPIINGIKAVFVNLSSFTLHSVGTFEIPVDENKMEKYNQIHIKLIGIIKH